MIPYVEVIGKYTLEPFALVEPSQCWFELSYYEIGEFEIYCAATQSNLNALKMGNYVKIPNKPYLWVIKSVQYKYASNGSRMISAKGYEAKWLLTRRIILTPWQLPTNLDSAVYQLVNNNMGTGAVSYRKIVGFIPQQSNLNITIEDTQATRENLWVFVSNLLKTNLCGAFSTFDGNINYKAIKGRDLSNTIKFSQSLDNLIASDYSTTSENYRTYCQVVSTFTENEVTTDYVEDYDLGQTGIDRSEISIQSNLSTKYTDENGNEQETTPDSSLYKGWQQEEGKNTLSEHIIKSDFSGEIDLFHSQYKFEDDFFIGDLVSVSDEYFNYSAKARILKYTFKQDAQGYTENADYQTE